MVWSWGGPRFLTYFPSLFDNRFSFNKKHAFVLNIFFKTQMAQISSAVLVAQVRPTCFSSLVAKVCLADLPVFCWPQIALNLDEMPGKA